MRRRKISGKSLSVSPMTKRYVHQIERRQRFHIGTIFSIIFLFGKIYFQEYEDGEVLVEHEPIRYELRDIKKDKFRTSLHPDPRVLGSRVLANGEDHTMDVESVIDYTYDKIIYWGTIEGVARGLPTEVYENPKLPPVNLGPTGWGFKINETKTEVRATWHIAFSKHRN